MIERKYRILMLVPAPYPTRQGTQFFIRELVEGLLGEGHDLSVLAQAESEYDLNVQYPLYRNIHMGMGTRSGPSLRRIAADMTLLARAHRVLERGAFDVIHAHNVEGLLIGGWLRARCGIPCVYHAHNVMGEELPTYFSRSWQALAARCLGNLLDAVPPLSADALIVFDAEHRQYYQRRGFSNDRIFTIPPALNQRARIIGEVSSFKDNLDKLIGGKMVVIYTGNPDSYQNLALLWASWSRVSARLRNALLVIGTHMEEGEFSRSSELPDRLGNVIVVRYRTEAELRVLLARADLAVCPRKHWFGVPIKVLNYLDAGLPVVACDSALRGPLRQALRVSCAAVPRSFSEEIIGALQSCHQHQHQHRPNLLPLSHTMPVTLQSYAQVYRFVSNST